MCERFGTRRVAARRAGRPWSVKTVRVHGACLLGTGAELVTVEARFEGADRGPTEVSLSGLPDSVIRESRGRWMCALKEARLGPRPGKLFLNLVPAARRKTGGALDLALALGAAAAQGHLDARSLAGTLFLGELGIDGHLHAVPGGLAGALAARDAGLSELVAPRATAEEAAWLPGVQARAAASLGLVVAALSGAGPPLAKCVAREAEAPDLGSALTLDDVRGQALAKRALVVAAAGGHGLLLVGPPGAGKSMLARRLLTLLPPPTLEERIEVTRVLSAAGAWPGGLARSRPFRAPHHTTSYAGLVGGGSPPAPGEITLAHLGLLFLDELPEFRREALEALRQPLETGEVTLSRAGARIELPARFQLVAAMNSCPCGHRGHPRLVCHCGEAAVARYRRRISGPLLDRIDLRLALRPPALEHLVPRGGAPPSEPSHAQCVEAVTAALERRASRQGARSNAALSPGELDACAPLDDQSLDLLQAAERRTPLSARALQALRRVARTLADLDGEARVTPRHVAEALALRGVELSPTSLAP